MDNSTLVAKNASRWSKVVFKQSALTQAASVAKRLVVAKSRYVSLSNKTGVPWYVIAVIHEREASQRWDRSLAQGDRWDRVSLHVPKGRGPFSSWEEAGIDALTKCGPYASRWSDWSIGGVLTLLELYNGLGYEKRGIASPYIWSGTNQYISGKYVSDGVFDATTVDSQLGCATLIQAMSKLDASIFETEEKSNDDDESDITPDQNESTLAPKAGPVGDADDTKPVVKSTTIWASIGTFFASVGGMLTDWKVVATLAVAALIGYIIWERSGKKDIKGLF